MARLLSSVTVRLFCASFMMLIAASSVLAEEEAAEATKAVKEAASSAPETSGAWKAFMLAIFLGIAVALGCFMSPRRGHQD